MLMKSLLESRLDITDGGGHEGFKTPTNTVQHIIILYTTKNIFQTVIFLI